MLKEVARKYYLEKGCNCSESLLYAANEYYNMGLPEETLKIMGGFGGGMGCKTTCGALSGSIAALSCMFLQGKAHENPEIMEISGGFVKKFDKKLGDTLCSVLEARNKKPDVRCVLTVETAAETLEEYIAELKGEKKEAPASELTPEDIKRVKALGFLHNKGTDCFNGRIITRNGKVTGKELQKISEAADKFGSGEVVMTTRLTMEVKGIPYGNIEAFRAFLAEEGLETGGTGSKVRPVVACKGTTCQYGLCDTYDLSEKIHQRFFKGYADVKLPHKFKIAVGGCPNNCVKPDLNDFGIIGQRMMEYDPELCKGCKKCAVEKACPIHVASVKDGRLDVSTDCNHCGRCLGKCPFKAVTPGNYGYRVVIGGRWGKKTAIGQPLNKIFTSEEEVMSVLEKAVLLFREQGKTGERFADTIARLGFENVEKQLLGDEILARKDEIIGAQLHLAGGATC
ncbi:MAG: C-GCAxxG-C-C family protein [Lachnospiraceae bacterium]|nr:C-GCAxxG-C-C family protein [Lachnospiraceae bacterium]